MNLYIWINVSPVSHNYHDDGGLVVVADSLAAARQLAHEVIDGPYVEGIDSADWKSEDPDHIWPIEASPAVIVFPNAGCC